jgi:YVTN family beta-propeller protein
MKSIVLAAAVLCAISWPDPLRADDTGILVVLNKSEASASILDLRTGEEIARLPTGSGPHEVAVSADGTIGVVADYGTERPGNTLTVLDLTSREARSTIDLGEHARPHGILFLDGNRILCTTEESRSLLVVDVRRGAVEAIMDTGGPVGHMVAVSDDRARAFVPNMYGDSLACFDLGSLERIALVELGEQPEGIDARPGSQEIWVTNRASNTISIVDSVKLEVVATLPCGEFPIRLKFTPDGRHALVSNARSGDLAVFDADTRKEVRRIPMLARAIESTDQRLFGDRFEDSPVPVGIVVHPQGTRAWVANTNADVISVIDLGRWELTDRLVAGKEPDGMAWAPSPASD